MKFLLANPARALLASSLMIAALLTGCSSAPPAPAPTPTPPSAGAMSYPALNGSSRWIATDWADLPGWSQDELGQAWSAWVQSCARPLSVVAAFCPQIRAMTLADSAQQRAWLQTHMQPYRIENTAGDTRGMLTSYYEPLFTGQRRQAGAYQWPLYAPPAGFNAKAGWYSRQEADTYQSAQMALAGKALAWFNNPVDPMILQVQGSGQVQISEADGRVTHARLAFAGTNQKPYQSVSKWLAANTSLRNYSWPAIAQWAQSAPPQAVQQMLWSNPRIVFFREEDVPASGDGPRGAQGVPLTPGRSIAVDPGSIPYGAPVWLVSQGADNLQRLVIAQDTGSAIRGAVRADFYAGTGYEAGVYANRIKQALWLWVLWPKNSPVPH
ncbi:MAG: murein transglycosylase A [Brachymonas sp.]